MKTVFLFVLLSSQISMAAIMGNTIYQCKSSPRNGPVRSAQIIVTESFFTQVVTSVVMTDNDQIMDSRCVTIQDYGFTFQCGRAIIFDQCRVSN
jgi:hypothetical protein